MYINTHRIGRNVSCPCGSGLKYKKCCLNQIATSPRVIKQQIQTNFKKKLEGKGKEVMLIESDLPVLKMSEVIIELINELLEDAETQAEKESIIQLACTAWNFALLKQRSNDLYEQEFSFFFEHMDIDDPIEQEEIQFFIDTFVKQKMEYYFDVDRWIIDYQLDFVGDEFILNIASEV